MDNVSFKANININYPKIKESMLFDRYFTKPYKKDLNHTLQQIEKLSAMKEQSTVELNPRLDNNQMNLICQIRDKSGKIKTTISERSGRKIASDENFAQRFVSNIAKTIKNVDITRKSLKKINKTIKESNTLVDDKFTSALPFHILESLDKGYNPAKRIISLLKQIEKEYPQEKNIISIKHSNSPSTSNKRRYTTTFFSLENNQIKKTIPIKTLLKDPAQNLFA